MIGLSVSGSGLEPRGGLSRSLSSSALEMDSRRSPSSSSTLPSIPASRLDGVAGQGYNNRPPSGCSGSALQRPPSSSSLSRSMGLGDATPPGSAAATRSGFSLLELEDTANAKAGSGEFLGRARAWSPEVEDLYRLQFCGWRDSSEYAKEHGEPERHTEADENGWCYISKVKLKSNGYFTYWRKYRQCEDKHVFKVRVFGPSSSS
eukprot:TRINITY_DN121483_c0_g1_i1.p1 TRINITY_DN121483_c0_g1~~TRINITY_DN121483_c0_g1_i1.p1  ORF type:complete len:205 (+),score=33.73 TRINITY_DN121483_c0_g1_i1:93-707(+)